MVGHFGESQNPKRRPKWNGDKGSVSGYSLLGEIGKAAGSRRGRPIFTNAQRHTPPVEDSGIRFVGSHQSCKLISVALEPASVKCEQVLNKLQL